MLSSDRCDLDRPINKRVNPHPQAPTQFPPLRIRRRNRLLSRFANVSFSLLLIGNVKHATVAFLSETKKLHSQIWNAQQ